MTSSVLFYLLLFYKLSSLSWAFNNAPPNVGIPLSTTSAERMPFEGGTSEKVQLKRRHLRVVVQFLQTAVTWTVCNSDADDLLSAMTHNPEAVHASSDTDELLFGSVATKATIHQQLQDPQKVQQSTGAFGRFLKSTVSWAVSASSDVDDCLSSMVHSPEVIHALSDTDELLLGSPTFDANSLFPSLAPMTKTITPKQNGHSLRVDQEFQLKMLRTAQSNVDYLNSLTPKAKSSIIKKNR
jgi:hypothetical protein